MAVYDYLVNVGLSSENFEAALKVMLGELSRLQDSQKVQLDITDAKQTITELESYLKENIGRPVSLNLDITNAQATLDTLTKAIQALSQQVPTVTIPSGETKGAEAGAGGEGAEEGRKVNIGKFKKEFVDVARIAKTYTHEQEGLFQTPGAKETIDFLETYGSKLESLGRDITTLRDAIQGLNLLSLVELREHLKSLPKESAEAKETQVVLDAITEAHKRLVQALKDTSKEQQKARDTIGDLQKSLESLLDTMGVARGGEVAQANTLNKLRVTFGSLVGDADNVADAISNVQKHFVELGTQTVGKTLGEGIPEVRANMEGFKETTKDTRESLNDVSKINDKLVQSSLAIEDNERRVAEANKVGLEFKKQQVEEEQRGMKFAERYYDALSKKTFTKKIEYLIPGEAPGKPVRIVTRQEYERYEIARKLSEKTSEIKDTEDNTLKIQTAQQKKIEEIKALNERNLEISKMRVETEGRGYTAAMKEYDIKSRSRVTVGQRYFAPGEGGIAKEVTREAYQRVELDRRAYENRRGLLRIDRELLGKAIRFGVIYRYILDIWKGIVNAAKATLKTIIEMDKIAGQIAKVSPNLFLIGKDAEKRLSDVIRSSIALSKKFGAVMESTAESMTLFFQQGLSVWEVLERTRGALELSTVTGLENSESVEILTAAYEIYGESIEKPLDFTNALIAVEQLHAVTARDLAKALLATGSTAREMGLSFYELMGMVTAIGVATRQTGKEVGTALRFILPRFFTQEAEQILDNLKISLYGFTQEGIAEMREMGNILFDVAMRWDEMSQAARLSFAVVVAGRRRANTFLALMKNFPEALKATEDALRSEGVAMLSLSAITERLDKQITNLTTIFKEFAFEVGETGLKDLMRKAFKWATKKFGIQTTIVTDLRKQFDTIFSSYAESAGVQLKNLPELFEVQMQEILYSLKNNSDEAKKLGVMAYTSIGKSVQQLIDYHVKLESSITKVTSGLTIATENLSKWQKQMSNLDGLKIMFEAIDKNIRKIEQLQKTYKGLYDEMDEMTGKKEEYKEKVKFRDTIKNFLDLAAAIDAAVKSTSTKTTFEIAGKPLDLRDAQRYLPQLGKDLQKYLDADILKKFNIESEILNDTLTKKGYWGPAWWIGKYLFPEKFSEGLATYHLFIQDLQDLIKQIDNQTKVMEKSSPATDKYIQDIRDVEKAIRESGEAGDISGVTKWGKELIKASQGIVLATLKQEEIASYDAVTVSLEKYKNTVLDLAKTVKIGDTVISDFSTTIGTHEIEIETYAESMSKFLQKIKDTGQFDTKNIELMVTLLERMTRSGEDFSGAMEYLFNTFLIPGWKKQIPGMEILLSSLNLAVKDFDLVSEAASNTSNAIEQNKLAVQKSKDILHEYNQTASVEANALKIIKTGLTELDQEYMSILNQVISYNAVVEEKVRLQKLEGKDTGRLGVRMEELKSIIDSTRKAYSDYFGVSGRMGKEDTSRLIELNSRFKGVHSTISKMPPAMQKMAISLVSTLNNLKGETDIPMKMLSLEYADPSALRTALTSISSATMMQEENNSMVNKAVEEYENYQKVIASLPDVQKQWLTLITTTTDSLYKLRKLNDSYIASLNKLENQLEITNTTESTRIGVLKDFGFDAVEIAEEEYTSKKRLLKIEKYLLQESLNKAKTLDVDETKVKGMIQEKDQALKLLEITGRMSILNPKLTKSIEDYTKSLDALNSYLEKDYSILSDLGIKESEIIKLRMQDNQAMRDLLMRNESLNKERIRSLDISNRELKLDKQLAEIRERNNKILQESEYRLKRQEFKFQVKGLEFEKMGIAEDMSSMLGLHEAKSKLDESWKVLQEMANDTQLQALKMTSLREVLSDVDKKESELAESTFDVIAHLDKQLSQTSMIYNSTEKLTKLEKTLSKLQNTRSRDVAESTLFVGRSVGIQQDFKNIVDSISYENIIGSLESIGILQDDILTKLSQGNVEEGERAKLLEFLNALTELGLNIQRVQLEITNRERERSIRLLQDQLDLMNRQIDVNTRLYEGESDIQSKLMNTGYEVGNVRREQERQLALITYSKKAYLDQLPVIESIYQTKVKSIKSDIEGVELQKKELGNNIELTETTKSLNDKLWEADKAYKDQLYTIEDQLTTLQLQETQINVNQRASKGMLKAQQAINAAQALSEGLRATSERAYQGRQEEAQLRIELELEKERMALQIAKGKMPERTAKGEIASIRKIEIQLEKTRKENRREWIMSGLEAAIPGFQKMVDDLKLKLIDEDQELKMRRLFIDNATLGKNILISGAEIMGQTIVRSCVMGRQALTGETTAIGTTGKPIVPTGGKAGFGDLLKYNDAIQENSKATVLGVESANNQLKNQLAFIGADMAKTLAVSTVGKGAPEAGLGADIGSMAGLALGISLGGPVGAAIGSAIGGGLGAAIGGLFADDEYATEENTDAVEQNTSELRRNTEQLKSLSEQVIGAPANFSNPQMRGMNYMGGGGGGITININAEGQDASDIARKVSREFGMSSRRGGNMSPGFGGVVIIGGVSTKRK